MDLYSVKKQTQRKIQGQLQRQGKAQQETTTKPAEVLETPEKKPDEMAQGKADVPEANSIKRPEVEKDGGAEEAGKTIKVPGIIIKHHNPSPD